MAISYLQLSLQAGLCLVCSWGDAQFHTESARMGVGCQRDRYHRWRYILGGIRTDLCHLPLSSLRPLLESIQATQKSMSTLRSHHTLKQASEVMRLSHRDAENVSQQNQN